MSGFAEPLAYSRVYGSTCLPVYFPCSRVNARVTRSTAPRVRLLRMSGFAEPLAYSRVYGSTCLPVYPSTRLPVYPSTCFPVHFTLKHNPMSSLLRLCRTAILPGGTEGILLLPTEVGLRSVATLEPPMSGAHPAIPAGEYTLRLDVPSPRFLRSPRPWSKVWCARLPRLEGVPGRAGILIHPGNRPSDSSGCLLVGRAAGVLRLADSVDTFHRLMQTLHVLPAPLRLRVE